MADWLVAVIGFGGLLGLTLARVPIGAALCLVGGLGYAYLDGVNGLLNLLKTLPVYRLSSGSLAVLPLFVLMGQFAARAGVGDALFTAARAWFGHLAGGVGLATLMTCGGFATVCGSSLATAATMGRVALPDLLRLGYHPALAGGLLAAGGTLGILIPPSVVLVVYGLLAEQNIATLFAAALLPGLLALLSYGAVIWLWAWWQPAAAPALPPADWATRWRTLWQLKPLILLVIISVGGLMIGVFTPTEGAAVGAAMAFGLACWRGGWRYLGNGLSDDLRSALEICGFLYFILLGADLFNSFLALSGLPQDLATMLGQLAVPPLLILVAMLLVYLLLGCVMDSLSMLLLTLPLFLPVLGQLDLGLSPDDVRLWFGILALICVEMGLISPPFGLNVFTIQRQMPQVSNRTLFLGAAPFLLADVLRLAVLIAFPAIVIGWR